MTPPFFSGPGGQIKAGRAHVFVLSSTTAMQVTLDNVSYILTEQSTFVASPFGADGLTIDGVAARPDLLYSYKLMLWDGLSNTVTTF